MKKVTPDHSSLLDVHLHWEGAAICRTFLAQRMLFNGLSVGFLPYQEVCSYTQGHLQFRHNVNSVCLYLSGAPLGRGWGPAPVSEAPFLDHRTAVGLPWRQEHRPLAVLLQTSSPLPEHGVMGRETFKIVTQKKNPPQDASAARGKLSPRLGPSHLRSRPSPSLTSLTGMLGWG